MKYNLTPEEALETILAAVSPPNLEPEASDRVEALERSLGRVLGADVIAGVNLPPFDNSAMDGYAIIAADLAGTSEAEPVSLRLLETIGAGAVAAGEVSPGNCIKIMTGAPVPAGADAVVMREETSEADGRVAFQEPARAGQNIRRAGSDVRLGETVIQAGSRVGPAEWAMLASLGTYPIPIYRRPRVAIIVTGDELARPEEELEPGRIRESNSFALRALVQECGTEVAVVRRVGDTTDELLACMLEVSSQCDAIVTSGGVSAGDFDPVRDVLREHAEVLFWKVSMKPGKPVMFAKFQDVPVFGLPGNPVSVMVAFELFVRPALLKMGGHRAWIRALVKARIEEPLRSPAGRVEFVRAHLGWERDTWYADFSGDQGSGRLSTMLAANALLVIPADKTALSAGDEVNALLLGTPALD